MDLREAKAILNECGYKLVDKENHQLLEAQQYLFSKGYLLEDTEGEAEPEETKTNDNELSDEEEKQFQAIVSKVKARGTVGNAIEVLNKMNKAQRALFRKAYLNSEETEHIDYDETYLPVTQLFPTQNEIDFDKSVAVPLKMKFPDTFKKMVLGEEVSLGGPVVISLIGSKYYIIDGHHRWSQVYMMNPKCKIHALVFKGAAEGNKDVIDVLKDWQGAVMAAMGKIVQKPVKGRNIIGMSRQGLKALTKHVLTKFPKTVEAFGKLNPKLKDIEAISENIAAHGEQMNANNKPIKGAPERMDMPQTAEKGPGNVTGIKVAKKGMVDL
jgi:hypothetical protein